MFSELIANIGIQSIVKGSIVMNRIVVIGMALLATSIAGSSAANANSPNLGGSWEIQFYNEPGRSPGVKQCFTFTKTNSILGVTKFSGTWTSSSFSGWQGQYIVEGDHLRMWGSTGSLATIEEGNLIGSKLIGGVTFTHFSGTTGNVSSGGSFVMKKKAACAATAKAFRSGPDGDPAAAN